MQTAFISLTKTKSLRKKTQQSWQGWGWGASANTVLTGFLGDAQGENGNSTLLDGFKPAGQETWAPRAKDLLFSHSVKWSFWFVFCISFCSLRMGMTYLISLKMMSSQELVSMPPPPRSQQRMTHDASLNLEMTTRGACWLSLPC